MTVIKTFFQMFLDAVSRQQQSQQAGGWFERDAVGDQHFAFGRQFEQVFMDPCLEHPLKLPLDKSRRADQFLDFVKDRPDLPKSLDLELKLTSLFQHVRRVEKL